MSGCVGTGCKAASLLERLDAANAEIEAWRNKPWAEQLREQAKDNAKLRAQLLEQQSENERLRAELAKARNDVERWYFALRHCAYYSMHEAYIIDMHIRGPAGSDMVRDIDCALKREGGGNG